MDVLEEYKELMMKTEYKMFVFYNNKTHTGNVDDLNKLFSEGWEMVEMKAPCATNSNVAYMLIYLRRQV